MDFTGKHVIVRSSAGVFAGILAEKEGMEVTIIGARRLWYWAGAASLSQLAMEGVKKPKECKFPCEMDVVVVVAIEIIPTREEARSSIQGVTVWKE